MTLLESQSACLTIAASALMNAGYDPPRLGNAHLTIVPYDVYKAQDKYIIVAVGTEKLWDSFCEVLGLDHLKSDPRFATNADRVKHRAEMAEILNKLFVGQPACFWLEKLQQAGVPSGPINSISDTLAHPQHQARNFIVELPHPVAGLVKSMGNPIRLGGTPVSYRLPPPLLGQHTTEILTELGYGQSAIHSLKEHGVV